MRELQSRKRRGFGKLPERANERTNRVKYAESKSRDGKFPLFIATRRLFFWSRQQLRAFKIYIEKPQKSY